MLIFGNYVIELEFADGEKGYFMEIYEGGIFTTDSIDTAEKYLTKAAAEKNYEKIKYLYNRVTGEPIVRAWWVKIK